MIIIWVSTKELSNDVRWVGSLATLQVTQHAFVVGSRPLTLGWCTRACAIGCGPASIIGALGSSFDVGFSDAFTTL